MSKLPIVSGQKIIKALMKIGYYIRNQEGSHIHLRHPIRKPLTIPNHKEIARGTLKTILREAGVKTEKLEELLK